MKPSDFPTGRTIPGEDDQVIIDMSMDEPEEAGANARSPSPTPDYENVEEAEVLMNKAEVEKDEARSPIYKAPGSRSPSRERSPVRPVLNAYYTQKFRPKHVFGPRPVPQVTQATLKERRKRKEDEVAQDQKRGRQREQDPGSRVLERQGPGPSKSQEPSPARCQGCWSQMATGNRQARMRSQDWICNCDICKTFPGREMGEELGPEEPGRRRLKVLST